MINPVLVPHAFYSTGGTHGLESKPDVCPPLKVGSTIGIPSPPSVMYGIDGEMNASESIIGPLKRGGEGGRIEAVAIPTAMVVRRLLPVECERLQGFPDGWTDVPYRGKPAPDGPRYKALGNSMAVPCMAWIGRRIQFAKESEQ